MDACHPSDILPSHSGPERAHRFHATSLSPSLPLFYAQEWGRGRAVAPCPIHGTVPLRTSPAYPATQYAPASTRSCPRTPPPRAPCLHSRPPSLHQAGEAKGVESELVHSAPLGRHTAMKKLRIGLLGISGGRSLTRPFRDAHRFPSTRWYPVPEAARTTLGFGICPSFKGHCLSPRGKP